MNLPGSPCWSCPQEVWLLSYMKAVPFKAPCFGSLRVRTCSCYLCLCCCSFPRALWCSKSGGIISYLLKKAGRRSEGLWGCRYYHASHHFNFDYGHEQKKVGTWHWQNDLLTEAKTLNTRTNIGAKEPPGVAELVQPDMKQKKRAEQNMSMFVNISISYQFQPLIRVQNSSFRNQMTKKIQF